MDILWVVALPYTLIEQEWNLSHFSSNLILTSSFLIFVLFNYLVVRSHHEHISTHLHPPNDLQEPLQTATKGWVCLLRALLNAGNDLL